MATLAFSRMAVSPASTPNDEFQELRIAFEDPNRSFQELEFNLNAAADGSVTLIATGGFGTQTRVFSVDRSGQNFFSLNTIGDDYLTSVTFITNVRVQDVKQVRIGGIDTISDNPISISGDLAPEGNAGTMLAFGFLPVGLILLRRKRHLPARDF